MPLPKDVSVATSLDGITISFPQERPMPGLVAFSGAAAMLAIILGAAAGIVAGMAALERILSEGMAILAILAMLGGVGWLAVTLASSIVDRVNAWTHGQEQIALHGAQLTTSMAERTIPLADVLFLKAEQEKIWLVLRGGERVLIGLNRDPAIQRLLQEHIEQARDQRGPGTPSDVPDAIRALRQGTPSTR